MEYRGYSLKRDPQFTYYSIHSIGKGALPKVLSGMFTKESIAKKEIDSYLDHNKPVKE